MKNKHINDCTKNILSGIDLIKNYIKRGEVYSELGLYDLALNDFNKVVDIDDRNYSAYFQRGCVYWKLEDWFSAIKDFTDAINLDLEKENDLSKYYNRGWI